VLAYIRQLRLGLGETGMQRPVYWGIYMTNFIFFIGLSLSGTFISAILRITGAEWRRPITRVAEAVTVFALVIATIQIIVDMGRPDRLIYVIRYGRVQSPILWDVFVVNLYLLSSTAYLYFPLIPDLAILRDNLPENAPAWRYHLYRVLAIGWRGNVEQWRRLEKAISVMAICIIPIAVFVHTITSWLLATTVQPGWHSTVFGPYFVVTAIFSGIAGLFLVMTAVRWAFGLEEYITLHQYRNLGLLFVTMSVIWGYFTYTESLILAAGQQTMEFPVLASKLWGEYAFSFWLMIGLIAFAFWMMAIPLLIPAFAKRTAVLQPRYTLGLSFMAAGVVFLLDQGTLPTESTAQGQAISWGLIILAVCAALVGISIWAKQHPIGAALFAGAAVITGTWLERWNIVVPTATHPRLIQYSSYTPTSTEMILTISSIALFFLLLIIFFKLFPAIPIWEIKEGQIIDQAQSQVQIPVPEPSELPGKKRRWRFQ
jgi:molybdopterin-containing oxidoreductase family membrane subunit